LSWNDCAISAIVKYELFYGAFKSHKKDATLMALKDFLSHFSEVAFDDKAAELAGKIRAELEIKGTPIGPNDLLIAAIALSGNFILVTNNTKEFERVTGLTVEDWQ
jgi:tRNA(fMet)-specific endonuclease VapC